jgi:hypothetical protein
LKLIKKGDSLFGTAYYYTSRSNYYRYTVKGVFNERNNTVVWWDDQLIEEQKSSARLFSPNSIPLLSEADFNCPGGDVMMLDGKASAKNTPDSREMPLHLDKMRTPIFDDEWDNVIEDYFVGANDPYIIDSVAAIAGRKPEPIKPIIAIETPPVISNPPVEKPRPVETEAPKPVINTPTINTEPIAEEPKIPPPIDTKVETVKGNQPIPAPTPTISNNYPNRLQLITPTDKFVSRIKKFVMEIPIAGDSLELSFYDNAEVDGDSVSLFLNNQLIFEHIRLTDRAYTIKIAAANLNASNELVMVAENLGSIPPNTSLMIAMIAGKRYEARLESTEQSSAMIRLVKQ